MCKQNISWLPVGTILSPLMGHVPVPALLGHEAVYLSQGSILDVPQQRNLQSVYASLKMENKLHIAVKSNSPPVIWMPFLQSVQIRMFKVWWPSTTLYLYTTPSTPNLLHLLIHTAGKPHETSVCIPFPCYVCHYSDEGNCKEATKNHQFACPFPQMRKKMEGGLSQVST